MKLSIAPVAVIDEAEVELKTGAVVSAAAVVVMSIVDTKDLLPAASFTIT